MTPQSRAEEWADKQCPGMDHTHIWWVAARANFEAGSEDVMTQFQLWCQAKERQYGKSLGYKYRLAARLHTEFIVELLPKEEG